MGEVDKVVERLRACANGVATFANELGDYGICDTAAALLTALQARNEQLDADCDRWINAYKIAVDQAMANGSQVIQLEAQLAEARDKLEAVADATETHRGFINQRPLRPAECLESLLGTLEAMRALTPGCEHQTGPNGDAGQ